MRSIFLLFALIPLGLNAQNTLSLPEKSSAPETHISKIAWMEGHWRGEAFGGITEEIWGPPLGGSMMFSFKLVVDEQVGFYELGHIRELNNTLVFELKHFDGELKGWEEKDEVQQFVLIKIDGNRVYFEGFTFERISADEINIYGLIGHDDGSAEEVKFNYKRR